MGCILSKPKTANAPTTISMIVRMNEINRSKNIGSPDIEEKKDIPAGVRIDLTDEMKQLLAKLNLTYELPIPNFLLLATKPDVEAALLLLNAKWPINREVIIAITENHKYAKKIVDAVLLLLSNNIVLSLENISEIASAGFYVDRVTDQLMDFKPRDKLNNAIINGIAQAGILAEPMKKALMKLSQSDIPLTDKLIQTLIISSDINALIPSLISLSENNIALTDHVLESISAEEYHASYIVIALKKLHSKNLLTDGNITKISRLKKNAIKAADNLILEAENESIRSAFALSSKAENLIEQKSIRPA